MTSTDLTTVEDSRLKQCEQIIKGGLTAFCDVGDALCEIRDAKLYRNTHGTFKDYCKDKWQLGESRVYQLMDQAVVVAALQEAGKNSNALEVSARDVAAVKPHLAEVTEEIRTRVAQGEDPVKTTYEVIEAKRAEIKPKPKAEPEPEDSEPDPWAELVIMDQQMQEQDKLIKSLMKDDKDAEIFAQRHKYAQLEGLVKQLTTTEGEAKKQAQYYADLLKKIRKAIDVTKNTEIIPAIQKLRASV